MNTGFPRTQTMALCHGTAIAGVHLFSSGEVAIGFPWTARSRKPLAYKGLNFPWLHCVRDPGAEEVPSRKHGHKSFGGNVLSGPPSQSLGIGLDEEGGAAGIGYQAGLSLATPGDRLGRRGDKLYEKHFPAEEPLQPLGIGLDEEGEAASMVYSTTLALQPLGIGLDEEGSDECHDVVYDVLACNPWGSAWIRRIGHDGRRKVLI